LGITSVGGSSEIWFTEFAAGKIAKISSAGVITEYPIPTPGSAPVGISGATGSIWFTESATNKIGHLTPAGFTETIIPTPASLPMGVLADPGGVWFAEVQGNKIGRLSASSGTIIETVIPTPNAGLTNLSSDNAGRVWFAKSAANKIGFLSPTGFLSPGVITEFSVPSPQSTPTHVAADFSAEVLWFTEQATNKIGFVTATGRFTEYLAPTPASQPTGIAVYLSGNIFFTELSANAIGSLHQDAIVFIATRGVAGWTTEFDIANAEAQAATVFGSQSFTPFFVCAGPCPPTIGLRLPAQGTGSAAGSQAVYRGDFGAVFFYTREDGVLPSVRARLVNPSAVARSIDLPGIRLSTLSSLGMTRSFSPQPCGPRAAGTAICSSRRSHRGRVSAWDS
jgi:streptogramin lyase